MPPKNPKKQMKSDYAAEVRQLKNDGPDRLYILWGEEDYLRRYFEKELMDICLPEGDDGFSLKRIDGPVLDAVELANAIDTMPFLSPRTLVMVRNVDINKLSDPDAVLAAISEIPEYCTVAFSFEPGYEPDGRLKFVKQLKSMARDICFVPQSRDLLVRWVVRRFAALGKRIELEAIQRLIFLSGDLMSGLIPEIDKIAGHTRGEVVTVKDVESIANRIPDAVAFDIADHISKKEYNAALQAMNELLSDRNNEPIALLALLGYTFRRLYAAAVIIDGGGSSRNMVDAGLVKYEDQARNYFNSARGFSLPVLRRIVNLCAETDYSMKSGSTDDAELLSEAVIVICSMCKFAEKT